jgi:hypothetical protein
LINRPQHPGVLFPHHGFKRWIETTPHQREMTIVVVQEALICKTRVIRVGLLKDIRIATRTALDYQRRHYRVSPSA